MPLVINVYFKTLRIKIFNPPVNDLNFVFIFWHSKMLLGWWLFRNKKIIALVSQSKDGDILNSVLNKWNYTIIRGSSTRGGKEAIQDIISLVKEKKSVSITPDGPKGPPFIIKNGALIVSNECHIPIIPIKIIYHRKKILHKSWDKFEIPFPFSMCEAHFGNNYLYEKYLDENELESFKKKLSEEM